MPDDIFLYILLVSTGSASFSPPSWGNKKALPKGNQKATEKNTREQPSNKQTKIKHRLLLKESYSESKQYSYLGKVKK